jgi:aminoglycoside 6'-N-acetyltransferase I
MNIRDLHADDTVQIEQAAGLLVEGFREDWPGAWPDMASARAEVHEMLGEDRLCRIAVGDDGQVLGWIGGIRSYDGHAWELHPLVVRAECRRQGIGRRLVADLEAQVAARGATTLFLGTDDVSEMTSLGGVDLYPDVLGHLARLRNRREHPYEFYLKVGFTVVGLLPDANGSGKPDIYMAKRVGPVAG